jgi:hypothetical protein
MTDRLPIEDPDEGLYLHQAGGRMPGGARVLKLAQDGRERYYVRAEDYMAVQKERDDYRRSMALVNAWRVTQKRQFPMLENLCFSAGFTDADGHAINDVIRGLRDDAGEDRADG